MKKYLRVFLAFAACIFIANTPLFAHEGEHEGMKMGSGMVMDSKDTLGDISDIWKQIRSHEEHLGQAIETNQLDQVHEVAFMIRDLSKALYEKSGGVSLVKGDELKASVDEIAKIANQLDEAGDAGDKAKTQEQFVKLQETLRTIEKQFPQEALAK